MSAATQRVLQVSPRFCEWLFIAVRKIYSLFLSFYPVAGIVPSRAASPPYVPHLPCPHCPASLILFDSHFSAVQGSCIVIADPTRTSKPAEDLTGICAAVLCCDTAR